MKIVEACKICFDKGIKVYPVVEDNYHKIEVSVNDKPKVRYKKILHKPSEVNEAMIKTYLYYAKKILDDENKLRNKAD